MGKMKVKRGGYGVVLNRQNLYHWEFMPTHLVKNKNHHQVKVQFH